MTTEAKWLLEELIKYGTAFTIIGIVVYLLITRWLSSYLHEKGKNLADKEDIANITGLVSGVEHQYDLIIKQIDAKQQMRMAAVDKRLQAHQEAFTLWRKLTMEDDQGEGPIALQCQDWWEKNCLYLEPAVRSAFVSAYSNAHLHAHLRATHASSVEVEKAWDAVMNFQIVLFKAIQLPPLTQEELKEIPENS